MFRSMLKDEGACCQVGLNFVKMLWARRTEHTPSTPRKSMSRQLGPVQELDQSGGKQDMRKGIESSENFTLLIQGREQKTCPKTHLLPDQSSCAESQSKANQQPRCCCYRLPSSWYLMLSRFSCHPISMHPFFHYTSAALLRRPPLCISNRPKQKAVVDRKSVV